MLNDGRASRTQIDTDRHRFNSPSNRRLASHVGRSIRVSRGDAVAIEARRRASGLSIDGLGISPPSAILARSAVHSPAFSSLTTTHDGAMHGHMQAAWKEGLDKGKRRATRAGVEVLGVPVGSIILLFFFPRIDTSTFSWIVDLIDYCHNLKRTHTNPKLTLSHGVATWSAVWITS